MLQAVIAEGLSFSICSGFNVQCAGFITATAQPGEQKAQGDLTKVYKNLRWGWGQKDKARDFSVLCTDRARGNEF